MAGVDLDGFELIVRDDFESFNRYDGTSGLWSTKVVRDVLVTNGPQSVFLDGTEVDRSGNSIGLNPVSVQDGKLEIGSGIIPTDKLAGVRDLLSAADQSEYAKGIKYYTGRVSTADTWGQEYGYFEITAKVPEGKGHWSAFWLEPAGEGWPPEIDIFEAYGRGVAGKTNKDNQFNQAVFFDRIDAEGNATQSIDVTNPYKLDAFGNPQSPDIRTIAGQELGVFHQGVNAQEQFGIDIYNSFNTYGAKWTPNEIIFYFGKDRDSLVEVYRTPTPDDLDSPMVLIANDQISSTWDWNPVKGFDHLTFAQGNTLQIEQISIYALSPDRVLRGTTDGATIVDVKGDFDTTILGTRGNDHIAPGHGLDFVELRGGSDAVYISRGVEGDVIKGFGRDDVAVIEGWNIEDPLARLTQVGNDVWLSNGSYPKDPQSVIFRDAKVADFEADDFLVRWSKTPNIWASSTKSNLRLADTDGDGLVTGLATGSILTDAGAYKGKSTLDGSDVGDRYYIYKSNTAIIENAGGGIDTVGATRSYTLGANLENIVASGQTNGSVLTGNSLGNRLESNGKAITFVGMGGDDFFDFGPGGANTIRVGAGHGHDVVAGFNADDVLVLEGLRFPSADDFRDAVSETIAGVVIDLGEDQSVTFRSTDVATVLGNTRYDLGPSLFTASRGGPGSNFALPHSSGPGVVEGPEPPPELAVFDNEIVGTVANDQLRGTNRTDRISGEAGNDNLNGGVGEDRLLGGAGNDNLTGSHGVDVLLGGAGNDRMTGGEADDRMYGGDGDDRFIFNAAGSGRDVILDYADGDDQVALTGIRVQTITDLYGDALVRLDQGGEIVFAGMTAAEVRSTVDFLLL